MQVGVLVVTYTAKHHLPHCLPPLLGSPLKPKVMVMNSSSNDGTVELAEEMGAKTLVIPRNGFNHGTSREIGRKALGCDIVVMITPDAYPLDVNMLGRLVQPLLEGKASVSYARQVPHDNADPLASFSRSFNYPSESHIRGIGDKEKWGVYSIFCSDSCAAYLNTALDEAGGFKEVLVGEDTFTVAKLLKLGHKIAYVSEAVVKHSHNYTLKQEFQRSFDTGLARKKEKELINEFGADEKRGADYVKGLLQSLWKKNPFLIPYALLQSLAKYAGYRIGRGSLNAPLFWKKHFSGQDFYWRYILSSSKNDG